MDLRMACLHRARADLRAAVHILADADARVLERAHDIVDELPPLDGCDDVAALQTGDTEPAAAQREAVAMVHDRLAEARALRHVGSVDDALALAEIQWQAAEQLDYDPLVTEAALELAGAQRAAGQFEPAEASYRRALRAALRGSQPERIVTAASGLLLVVGIELGRPGEAMLLADVARGAADRTGDPLHDAELRDAIGIVLRALGRFAEAEAEHRSAIASWERTLDPDASVIAKSRTNLGLALGRQARYAEAEAEHRAAVAILERTLGATHPDVAKSRNNLAIALQRMGLHDAAVVEYEGAIEATRAALGERHPLIVAQDLAICEALQGTYDAGLSADGVLSTLHESGVAHVHQLLLAALAGAG
jgi:tetratricopeptide (TPR) repeat protein